MVCLFLDQGLDMPLIITSFSEYKFQKYAVLSNEELINIGNSELNFNRYCGKCRIMLAMAPRRLWLTWQVDYTYRICHRQICTYTTASCRYLSYHLLLFSFMSLFIRLCCWFFYPKINSNKIKSSWKLDATNQVRRKTN